MAQKLSFPLCTCNNVPGLGHNFEAISNFVNTVSVSKQNHLLLLKTPRVENQNVGLNRVNG